MLPEPMYVDAERFTIDDARAVGFFEDRGWVVFRNALSSSEVVAAEGLLWDYLESIAKINRDDPTTWTDDQWPPGVGTTGILAFLGVGQSKFLWFVRTRKAVKKAFRTLWRTNEPMLTSFDGCLAWRDADIPPVEGWHHCDQNFLRRPRFECIQGLVNLYDVDETTGGNLLVDQSHRTIFPQLEKHFSKLGKRCDDFFELPFQTDTNARHLLSENGDHIVVKLRPGDLLCFDSRTIHCSAPPSQPRRQQNRLRRDVAFVSRVPKSIVDPAIIAKRPACVTNGITTTHWVTKLQPTTSYATWDAVQAKFIASDDSGSRQSRSKTKLRPDIVHPDVLKSRSDIRSLVLGDNDDDSDDSDDILLDT